MQETRRKKDNRAASPKILDYNSFRTTFRQVKDALGLVEDIENFDKEYTILERIGQGKYGSVFKAKHNKTETFVAVKCVYAMGHEMEELLREIEIMKGLDCSNIVRYYGTFFKDNTLFIIMEYCYYGSAGDIMTVREKPYKEQEISVICKDVLKGLDYLHDLGSTHRDIKADNILINKKVQFKLADFGVSGRGDKLKTVIGTPFFVAPEVIINEGYYDCKVDIWSLGITAIELAEMEPPCANEPPMKVLFNIPTKDPPTLKEKEKYSSDFNDFISKCLIKDPESRPTAAELLQHPFIINAPEENEEVMEQVLQEADEMIAEFLNTQENEIEIEEISSEEDSPKEESLDKVDAPKEPEKEVVPSQPNVVSPQPKPESPNVVSPQPETKTDTLPQEIQIKEILPVEGSPKPSHPVAPITSPEPIIKEPEVVSPQKDTTPVGSPTLVTRTSFNDELSEEGEKTGNNWMELIEKQFANQPALDPAERFGSTKRIKKLQKRRSAKNLTLADIVKEEQKVVPPPDDNLGKTIQEMMEEETKKLEEQIDQGLSTPQRTRRDLSSSGSLTNITGKNSPLPESPKSKKKREKEEKREREEREKREKEERERKEKEENPKNKRLSRFFRGSGKK